MGDHHHHGDEDNVSLRRVLECMTWAGTGVPGPSLAACRIRSAWSAPRRRPSPPA